MLFKAGSFIEFFGLYLSLALNICLLSDLILMIKYPFKDKDSRLKIYITFSIFLSAFVSVFLVLQGDLTTNMNGFSFFIYAYVTLILYAMISTYYAYHKLSKPGISGEIRTLVLKRHVVAVTAYIICNSYVFLTAIYLVNQSKDNSKIHLNIEKDSWWKILLKVLFYC